MRVIIFFMISVALSLSVRADVSGFNNMDCHKNNKTGDDHCHRDNVFPNSNTFAGDITPRNEESFNIALAKLLRGQTEVVFLYDYGEKDNPTLTASIRIDIMTADYVIEGGLDKRSSLDSIQQAVFASTLSGKEPAVAIYDTDGLWGKFEHRIWTAANKLGVRFFWFDGLKLKTN